MVLSVKHIVFTDKTKGLFYEKLELTFLEGYGAGCE